MSKRFAMSVYAYVRSIIWVEPLSGKSRCQIAKSQNAGKSKAACKIRKTLFTIQALTLYF
jgi:hypothetical protein